MFPTISACIYFQALSALGLQVRADHLPASAYGALLGVIGLLIPVLEVPLTLRTQRFSARRIIAAGFLLNGVGFGLTARFTSFHSLVVAVAVWTLGEMLGAPVASAFVADLSPPICAPATKACGGPTSAIGLIVGPARHKHLRLRSHSALAWLRCGRGGSSCGVGHPTQAQGG